MCFGSVLLFIIAKSKKEGKWTQPDGCCNANIREQCSLVRSGANTLAHNIVLILIQGQQVRSYSKPWLLESLKGMRDALSYVIFQKKGIMCKEQRSFVNSVIAVNIALLSWHQYNFCQMCRNWSSRYRLGLALKPVSLPTAASLPTACRPVAPAVCSPQFAPTWHFYHSPRKI